ncbi:class I SAM-dependent methyltransferase [Galbibacter sp. EGI 63066]|uniref:class I SAM-dependent methyltransferase n=1 Tax=Galbibacter sp. EGI 63066 TaxID=2993559 RepID=UPI00224920BA|nr:class I SAM-dependent methyltransferase [Galbibacter sp. EGI 63066]MCX2680110.1 class I SAM-dependent methyltransferase [Galbibacter sp. EGI 63066]
MNCPLCDTTLTEEIDEGYYNCSTCFAIVKDKKDYLSLEVEKARYETHNNDVNDVRYQNFTSPITDYVLEKQKAEHLGLDFGCGTGPVISKMLEDNGYHIEQYDPFFKPDTVLLDNTYDYIVSCEVFEHFFNPKEEIDKLYKLLKLGGRLLIMTLLYSESIDFEKWEYRNDATHVFFYRKKTIEYIAKHWGFKIEKVTDRFIGLKKLE